MQNELMPEKQEKYYDLRGICTNCWEINVLLLSKRSVEEKQDYEANGVPALFFHVLFGEYSLSYFAFEYANFSEDELYDGRAGQKCKACYAIDKNEHISRFVKERIDDSIETVLCSNKVWNRNN